MSPYPDLYILRHGQTEWNLAGRMQGHLDSPLTALGQAQALQQGRILRSLSLHTGDLTCLSSPQGRAAQTAQIALNEIGRGAVEDARLMETDMGEWQNCLTSDIRKLCPDNLWDDLGTAWYFFTAPNGESYLDQQNRCRALLENLQEPAILVTHGITSKVLRGLYLGMNQRDTVLLPGGQGCVYHMKNGEQWLCDAENLTGTQIERTN